MTDGALPPGAYLAPVGGAEAEIRERGSRFVAIVRAVDDEEAGRRELERVTRRFPDATHHCWAWRLGPAGAPRSSDAGEPSGTAGLPILRALQGAGLSDALVVVVRWFGGTKLGKGGLARAYGAAAREALSHAAVERRVPSGELVVVASYPAVGAVKRLLRPPEIELVSEDYGADVRFVLRVADHRRQELEEGLAELRVQLEARH